MLLMRSPVVPPSNAPQCSRSPTKIAGWLLAVTVPPTIALLPVTTRHSTGPL